MVCTGVGKSQAAGAAAWACGTISCQGVLSIGLGGVLPKPPHEVGVGAAVLASRSLFADEGGLTPDGFRSIDAMGFPVAAFGETGMPCDPMWAAPLGRVADATGWIATVSTCSGTDASARTVADRTGAIVENMEGAAVAAAISRLPKPPRFAEIRVISNTTGDRGAQQWDLPRALDRLGVVALAAAEAILAVDDPDP